MSVTKIIVIIDMIIIHFAFKFPVDCHFGFYDVKRVVAICQEIEVLLCEIILLIRQPYDAIKSKMVACRNFQSRTR